MQVRSDWFLPICTGAERLKDETGRKTHPTQKPEALLTRVLLAASNAGDLVLDPFFGSGTTGVAARRLAARSSASSAIRLTPRPRAGGSTRSSPCPKRRSRPRRRAAASRGWPSQASSKPDSRARANGWSTPGRRHSALVRADGALAAGPAVGSIHKIGALVQGLPACNGWTFWHVERGGR